MVNKVVDLYQSFGVKKPDGAKADLEIICHEKYEYCQNRKRPAMLVIPGGGYGHVSRREMAVIAFYYLNKGYNTFTLDYSIAPLGFPNQLIEASMAVAYIRENAEELGVLPDKIAAVGFSAGGHLCGMVATMHDAPEVKAVLGDRNARPDAVILSYPVISALVPTHRGSFDVQCKGDKELEKRLSIETNIDKNSPPAFIWGTANDGCVPCDNAFEIALAYKKNGVSFEFHMFADGAHGLSLANEEVNSVNKSVQPWLEMSVTYLKSLGFEFTE